MKNDFDRVAKFYQFLSKLVFSDRLIEAQVLNLKHLKAKDKVLIVGGGNGEILKHLPKELELKISYVELSSKMIKIAKNRSVNLTTTFYNQDIHSFDGEYDVVIANFFLDCFKEESLKEVLKKLRSLLTAKGMLLVTDFDQPRTRYDRFLLWSMHKFFGVFSNLESKGLLPLNHIIAKEGFEQYDLMSFQKPALFNSVYMLTD